MLRDLVSFLNKDSDWVVRVVADFPGSLNLYSNIKFAMFCIKLRSIDHLSNVKIRIRTKVKDVVIRISEMKWSRACIFVGPGQPVQSRHRRLKI